MSDIDSEDENKVPETIRNSSSETSYDEDEEEEEAIKEPPVKEEKEDETLVQAVASEEAKMSTSVLPQQPQPRRKRFIPKYEVEGVYRVKLSEETQQQIEIVVGTHVNVQYPWKMVSKAKIMEIITLGGELCEFFSLFDELDAYEDDDILMGYIVEESQDLDEFYICVTPAARDHCKQQSDKFIRRQEKKLEKAVQKKPRPWKSLGSEAEIAEQIPVNTRTLMEIEIKAKFPTVYQPDKFKVRDTSSVRDGFIELKPYRQKFNNVYRRRVDCEVQVAPALVNRSAQTELKYPQNMWTQSIADALGQVADEEAGGDTGKNEFFDEDDEESSDDEDEKKSKLPVDEVGLTTYRDAMRRMRRPSYLKQINKFVTSKFEEIESIVELNTVMDMYCNDYPNLVAHKSTATLGTMTFEEYVCFTDVRAKDKYVSSAVFHPMWSGIVAISYSDDSPAIMKAHTSSRVDPIQRAVYGLNPVMIWSHIDSLIPKLYLESPREVKVLSFCPFNENILVGGLVNGQIIIWDLTQKLENVEKIEVLSETREKYRIAMNAHMGWMKSIEDRAIVNSTALSNLMTCHYGPVTSIRWLSPNFKITRTGKTNTSTHRHSLQFLSGSEDGNILVWNLAVDRMTFTEGKAVKKSKRVPVKPAGLLVDVSPFKILDRIFQPSYKIMLGIAGNPRPLILQSFGMSAPKLRYVYTPRNNGTGRKYFKCEVLLQEKEDINTIIYCGSQHGELTRVTWEGHEFNTGEVVNSEYCDRKFVCCIHDGIITCTTKNPFIESITLTVGGKIFAIWSDKLVGRPIIWKKRPYRLTDGAWSIYKASLLFLTNSEGDLETWDLVLRSDKPISVQTLSGSMLTGVSLHTLPLAKNILGVSDVNGSFRMFLNPPIFMLQKSHYTARMEAMINREMKVLQSFIVWQDYLIKNNPNLFFYLIKKEGELLEQKDEEKRKQKEEMERRHAEELEARRAEKMKYVGPEERWQKVIQKLIERTIAVKKRINRQLLKEHEKPLRELETQRLEKERRMLEIMKNQKTIFNDTVAILFPEAIKKPPKVKKSLLSDNKEALKQEYLEDYKHLKESAINMVQKNPYKVAFHWASTLAEGKERRECLNAQEDYVKMHKYRIEEEGRESVVSTAYKKPKQKEPVISDSRATLED